MISSKAGADVLCTADLGRCVVHYQDRKVYGVLCTARPRIGRCIVHCQDRQVDGAVPAL